MSDSIIYQYINTIKSYIKQLDALYNFKSDVHVTLEETSDLFEIIIYDQTLSEFLTKTNLISNFIDMIDIKKMLNAKLVDDYELENVYKTYILDIENEFYIYVSSHNKTPILPVLPNDTWIGIRPKFKPKKHKDYDNKPFGSYFSKGDWIYHDIFDMVEFRKGSSGIFELIKIDTDKIIFLETETDFDKFNKKYSNYVVDKFEPDWNKVRNDYSGIRVSHELAREPNGNELHKYKMWTHGYDVETLVIFNEDAIIKKDTFEHQIFNSTEVYPSDYFDNNQLKLLFKDIKSSLEADT